LITTYVIGLREGLEAALIVSIVAAFLRRQGQREALRYMWIGVALAVVLCTAVGIALQLFDEQLPQNQQEQLETVVAVLAVAMVTFMIVWMRRNAAGLRGEIERSAARRRPSPRARSSAWSRWPSSPSCARASRRPCSCWRRFRSPATS
jgi:high-affinity iron transporter